MPQTLTSGISVSVEVFYQHDYSNPLEHEFMFAYRITIENRNHFAVQLLHRYWQIFDSSGTYRKVDGEGVVGAQPIINPGEQFQYVSGCNLKTEMGTMKGSYQMLNLNSREKFSVQIPAFEMMAPQKNN
jgi:ApaG protein